MKTEKFITDEARMTIQGHGGVLWRNNSGALPGPTGRPVRFGLGNDSTRINRIRKSADLIGVMPIEITADMVGKTIGIFVAVETKKEGFKGPKSKREIAQQTFLDEITKRGGIGLFLDNTDDLEAMIRGCRQGRLCTPAAE